MQESIIYIGKDSKEYPQRLTQYKGMPKGIYVKGCVPKDEERTVAIVGARMCSQYGKKQAYDYAKSLASAGISVISGLAKGVDGYAHEGALAAGGTTYAVLGCGADICYPASNRDLYERIPFGGGIISEFPNGTSPKANHFPMRNRIISALADVVLVIEAKEKSGSLITADFALEQGKDVYAVPGRVDDALSYGTNRLIAQGAGIAYSPEMLLDELGISFIKEKNRTKKTNLGLAREFDLVYSCMDLQPKDLHTILEEVELPAEQTMNILLKLQIDGKIREVFRNCYVKT